MFFFGYKQFLAHLAAIDARLDRIEEMLTRSKIAPSINGVPEKEQAR